MKTKNYKSRSNWNIPLCFKFDCKNRGKKCETCIRFSNYKKDKNETKKDNSNN